jgi:hypothetical protein
MRVSHPLDVSRWDAAPVFTGRDRETAIYLGALQAEPSADPQVIVFYGVGGIGKTALLQHLMAETNDRALGRVASVNFASREMRSCPDALQSLRVQLETSCKVRFPRFDAAFTAYWEKSRSAQRKAVAPMGGTPAQYAAELASAVGAPGTLILKVVTDSVASLQRNRTQRGLELIRMLPSMEPNEIVAYMPALWSQDVRDALAKMAADTRLVVFLDTYETLAGGSPSLACSPEDRWLRDLIGSLPEALWVVGSRERVTWNELSDWEDCLEQVLVGGLSPDDCERVLVDGGVASASLRDSIGQASRGHPFYLDLAIDLYRDRVDRGLEVEAHDFGYEPVELYEQFVRYLADPSRVSELETLRLLSCAHWWDPDLFVYVIGTFDTGYPATASRRIDRFSFVSHRDGRLYLHDVMRESLNARLRAEDPSLTKQVHGALFEYFENKLDEARQVSSDADLREPLGEAVFHAFNSMDDPGFASWLAAQAKLTRSVIRGDSRLSAELGGLLNSGTPPASAAALIDTLFLADEIAGVPGLLSLLDSADEKTRTHAIYAVSCVCCDRMADDGVASMVLDDLIARIDGPDGPFIAHRLRFFNRYRTTDLPSDYFSGEFKSVVDEKWRGKIGEWFLDATVSSPPSDTRVKDCLHAIAYSDDSPFRLRLWGFLSLGALGDNDALHISVGLTEHMTSVEQIDLLRSLAKHHSEAADARLLHLLLVPDAEVRAEAAETIGETGLTGGALGESGLAAAKEGLIFLLEDDNQKVRARAARALGRLAADEAVPQLEQALNDTAPDVRALSGWALRQIAQAHPLGGETPEG